MHGNVGERLQTSLPAPVAGSKVLEQFAYWPHEMQTMLHPKCCAPSSIARFVLVHFRDSAMPTSLISNAG